MKKTPKRTITRHSTGDAAFREREEQARYHADHLLDIWFDPEICPEARSVVRQRRSDYKGWDEETGGPDHFIEQLQTSVYEVHYYADRLLGALVLPAGYCTDMTGAIAFFKRIDPRVRQVQVFEERRLDIVYDFTDAEGWVAKMPRSAR